jgi:hypothetical protein
MKGSALLGIVAAVFLTLLAVPANAQATRTWVSGVGDDANPCSRTAPCKTFAGAISKTATAGEINCLDPGGFGAVTITKSIIIDCESVSNGGVLVSGTNGIVITAGPVTLRGLDIDGFGTGLSGVSVTSSASVIIQKSKIYGFATAGINFAAPGSLVVTDTRINTNAAGIILNGAAGAITATLRDVVVNNNTGNGIAVQTTGPSTTAVIDRTTVAFNTGIGVTVNGGPAAAYIGGSTITGNGTGVGGGGQKYSFKNNQIGGNTADGTPITSFPGPGGALQ